MTLFILLAAVISWGISNPLADLAVTEFSPIFLSLIECSVGFIFLLLVALIRRKRPHIPWKLVVPIGIIQPGLAWLFGNIGYTHETASTGVLILTGETLFTVLIGVFWLGDHLTNKQWGYFLIGMSGVIIASSTGKHFDTSSTAVFFIFSSLLFGIYANLIRKYLAKFSALDLALGQTFVASVFLSAIFLLSHPSFPHEARHGIWISAILSGLFGVGLPFVAFNYALAILPGRVTGASLNVIPIAGVGASIILGRGAPTLAQVIGGVLVIASVAFISRTADIH